MGYAEAAEYVRGRVEDGTDPVMRDPEQYRNVVREAVASSGLCNPDPELFLSTVDKRRELFGDSRVLGDIVHEALFGDILD
jgi:hypothetical protein